MTSRTEKREGLLTELQALDQAMMIPDSLREDGECEWCTGTRAGTCCCVVISRHCFADAMDDYWREVRDCIDPKFHETFDIVFRKPEGWSA